MARKQNNRKNQIQNVRVVDKDEGTDDIMCQRFLQAYNTSEGQIRVVCGYRGELVPSGTLSGVVAFGELLSTDDFVSLAAQYQEYRVRAIRFDIYDINPSSSSTINYWATFHQVGATVPVGAEDILDRPDARSISPGDGKTTLAWVAHGIPEMQFNNVGTNVGLGGLAYFVAPTTVSTSSKYTIMAKFIVDFRGRR